MNRDHEFKKLRHALMLGGAAALLCTITSNTPAIAQRDHEKIFETSITNDLNVSSGEPEIAIDPRNPSHLAVIEFGIGSAATPAATFNPMAETDPEKISASSQDDGRVMLSNDRGAHWHQAGVPPASDPNSTLHGGGDPMIAIGPDGTIYAGDEPPPASKGKVGGAMPASLQDYLTHFNFMIAASTDGGHTFAPPQIVGTPVDRPWLTVDQSTGVVYTVSSGALDVKTGAHNKAGPDAPNDRWLVAWQPHLTAKSEPHRIGGPDFSGSGGNTITAANGVVAATFILGGPAPGMGFTGSPPAPTPIPASLQGIVKDGTTSCSMQEPCLFFETSSDQGEHWTRHQVVVRGGFAGGGFGRAQVSADPGRPGRYAIGLLASDKMHFIVLTTDDSGATWSEPVAVPEATTGVDFKQWMAYGPTGVLGFMWRKERLDLTPSDVMTKAAANPVFATTGPAYDIYAAISCDGGSTWPAPVRVNAKTSEVGPPGRDDLSYIALDGHYAHLVWGDHRAAAPVPGNPKGVYIAQAYYGRVPFSVVTHGASCGRS